ncbi:hypothetical protein C8J56DRAFT_1107360 [Mycena floridula]|nr:hypothetical protein C8J56DRAFT_1107360 [Mycena floridula]
MSFLPLAFVILTFCWFWPGRKAEPYGLFHLALNREPEDDPSTAPRTEWLNMGYWKNAKTFPHACEALASKLLQASNVRGHVLDVGHGTGDSLLLLINHVPQPTTITGITSLPIHNSHSRARIDKLQPSVPVKLYIGDVVGHPLFTDQSYDTILALDCAYHFNTRKQFLLQSFGALNLDGKIALADICFDEQSLQSRLKRFFITRAIPAENAISKEQYILDMVQMGFTGVKLEDISPEVFPGFIRFLKRKGIRWWIFGTFLEAYIALGAKFAISISGYEERTSPKPHTVYAITVKAHVRSWQMWRRYSEFDDLHSEITRATGSEPPNPLPPKHKFSILRSHSDPKLLEERRIGLELFLRGILSSKDDKWRETYAFKEFLGVPIGRQGTIGGGTTQFTMASWLDEHIDLQNRLRDVRAEINKREALSDQGDVSASHKSNVSAKQKLAGVLSRIGGLGKALQQLAMNGMTDGELQRRTDMVARLQDDCEKLGKMVSVARQSSRGYAPSNPTPSADREELLGSSNNAFTRITRVFGASAEPQETEATRPLDDQGLLGMQNLQIEQQDEQLSFLTSILQRQRHLGEEIGHQIRVQIEGLDALNNEVDQTSAKLAGANRQMGKLR